MVLQASAQMEWNSMFTVAQAKAINQNKLILIDFVADWCGPCKMMDKEMWSKPEAAELTANLIPLKVDIDRSPDLKAQYNITSIPRVLIVTPWGDIVWDETGYGGDGPYFSTFRKLPDDFGNVLKDAGVFMRNEADYGDQFDLALRYQDLANEIDHKEMQMNLFRLSSNYLKTVEKKASSPSLVLEAEIHQYLNFAYMGKTKKAMKKIDKMDSDDPAVDELKSFVKAYCFKCDGEDKKMEKEIKNIKNEQMLAKLKEQ